MTLSSWQAKLAMFSIQSFAMAFISSVLQGCGGIPGSVFPNLLGPTRYPFDVMTCNAGQAQLQTQCMDDNMYDAVSETIKSFYDRVPSNCDDQACPQADWAGCVLRMAGHDFMDFNGAAGGSDGCVDFEDQDNIGLDPCLYKGEFDVSLFDAYQFHCTNISLADFLVVSAEAIMSLARERNSIIGGGNPPNSGGSPGSGGSAPGQECAPCLLGGHCPPHCGGGGGQPTPDCSACWFGPALCPPECWPGGRRLAPLPAMDFKSQFRFGRKTSQTCEAPPKLPDAEQGCNDVKRVFIDRMGLSWRQSAALMGVHSLGRARKENSGYNGWWSDAQNSRVFNNNYFISIVTKGWRAGRTPRAANNRPGWVASRFILPETEPGKTQWTRFDHGGAMPETTRHEMMLNTDLCLMYANPQGNPVLAANDDCCTWTPPEMVDQARFQQIMRNSGGAYCGASVNQRQPTANHMSCCHNTEWETCAPPDPRTGETLKFGGPAEKDVLEFAADEGAWRKTFLVSWKKATENGQGSLQRLGSCQR